MRGKWSFVDTFRTIRSPASAYAQIEVQGAGRHSDQAGGDQAAARRGQPRQLQKQANSEDVEALSPDALSGRELGMRPQEYLALSGSALRENGVYVDRAIEGSGKEISVTKTPAGRRFIELSPDTLDMVRHYAENHAIKNDHDLVFPTDTGQWQSRRNWHQRGFNAACQEAGLTRPAMVEGKPAMRDGKPVMEVKYCPYDLRHFFASMLFEKKANLKKDSDRHGTHEYRNHAQCIRSSSRRRGPKG